MRVSTQMHLTSNNLTTSEDKQCELRERDVFYTAGNFHQDLLKGNLMPKASAADTGTESTSW